MKNKERNRWKDTDRETDKQIETERKRKRRFQMSFIYGTFFKNVVNAYNILQKSCRYGM